MPFMRAGLVHNPARLSYIVHACMQNFLELVYGPRIEGLLFCSMPAFITLSRQLNPMHLGVSDSTSLSAD